LVLDLNPAEKEILKKMKKDCRRAIEKTQGLTVEKCFTANLKKFRQEWKKTVNFKRFVPPLSQLEALKRTFKNESLFLLYKQKTSFNQKSRPELFFKMAIRPLIIGKLSPIEKAVGDWFNINWFGKGFSGPRKRLSAI